ncbi:Oxoglutarate and iron-dependent oxygenase degradation C-term-domain-containing protein [Xylariaceae sp. FL0804]|nr:Oxoglutarate and iron-dependent oxygenase degradation C-term-domain-containing protein [Xylariaceae sp. FL0804]
MKRKAESQVANHKPAKKKSKTSLSDEDAKQRFRKGLFDKTVLEKYTKGYAQSSPYKHSVIHELIDDKLLRAVRDEIKDNVSFTPKETDIYKIHQSGDLANLDGLDDEALSKLPSLLSLRDAMYSQSFRDYVAHITGCGPLSGRKTDMAINVYTPGCYLLCHDDVIGSRRVSYILYLTDPDVPWKAEWGGALRLFPVTERRGKAGELAKTPTPDVSRSIPPAWNQLSFFAVQPGESFHDVEEVYHAPTRKQLRQDGGRVRMAISGWFHIPQIGEAGYVEGAEEANAKNSSLMQLQGDPDQYDMPQARPVAVEEEEKEGEDSTDSQQDEFDEADLEFLLRFMAPTYLTPDTLEQIAEHFDEDSSITLPNLLGKKFAKRLRDYVTARERAPLPESSAEIEEEEGAWRVARPPHKHRYLYMQPRRRGEEGKEKEREEEGEAASPLQELVDVFLPSPQFRRWLQMATGCRVESHDLLARRFRRGADYTLATGHEGKPRLEFNLGITPTTGWGGDAEEEEEEKEEEEAAANGADRQTDGETNGHRTTTSKGKGTAKEREKTNGKAQTNGKNKKKEKEKERETGKKDDHDEEGDDDDDNDDMAAADGEVGGHEVYMAGDDPGDDDKDDADARDAAVYRGGDADGDGDGDDNILFFTSAAWNRLSVVLRDRGALRFVKYVSRRAPGDRWDVCGTFEVEEEPDDEEEEGEGMRAGVGVDDDTTEEEWNGFPPSSPDSDSD